jgi:hypothetical protein
VKLLYIFTQTLMARILVGPKELILGIKTGPTTIAEEE